MDQSRETLPEGTDSIILGASVEGEAGDGFAFGHGREPDQIPLAALEPEPLPLKDEAAKLVGDKTAGLRDQATDKVRTYAVMGKDKATDTLDDVVRMIGDAANTVDDKVGAQYGDYVRRAGDTLAGIATTLKDKDVDDLVADARGVVRGSPAIAIGAAAAVGFLVARIAKAGVTPAPAPVPAPGDADYDRPAV